MTSLFKELNFVIKKCWDIRGIKQEQKTFAGCYESKILLEDKEHYKNGKMQLGKLAVRKPTQ